MFVMLTLPKFSKGMKEVTRPLVLSAIFGSSMR
jgi:hypothetical protein